MKLAFEYGQGMMTAELPDSTDVFIPGETVPDPPCIPEDQIEAKTLESIRNHMGMEPLSKLAHKGSRRPRLLPRPAERTRYYSGSFCIFLHFCYNIGNKEMWRK